MTSIRSPTFSCVAVNPLHPNIFRATKPLILITPGGVLFLSHIIDEKLRFTVGKDLAYSYKANLAQLRFKSRPSPSLWFSLVVLVGKGSPWDSETLFQMSRAV